MEEVRDRINLVTTIGARKVTIGTDVFDIELVFVQLRKVLELIAFASLTANKAKYSAAHATFAEHWKAKLMLKELEKVNPEFYPVPIGQPQLHANAVKNIQTATDGVSMQEDFAI